MDAARKSADPPDNAEEAAGIEPVGREIVHARPYCALRELHIVVPVLETGVLGTETQFHIVDTTASVLGDYELGEAAYIVAVGVGIAPQIIFRTMNETHDVGILLYGAALTQVAQLRPLAVGSGFDRTVELRQCHDRNIQLLGQLLQRPRNHADLLLAAAELHARRIHQLQIVDYDELDFLFTHKPAGLVLSSRIDSAGLSSIYIGALNRCFIRVIS